MPGYVIQTIYKLIPLTLLISFFDVFGLLIILPVIKIILNPQLIHDNQYLSYFYDGFGVNNEMQFVLILLGIIVVFFCVKNIIVYVVSNYQAKKSYSVATRLTVDQYELYLMKPYEYHAGSNSGDLLRSIIEIPFNFVGGIFLPFILFINELIVALIIASAVIYYNPTLLFSILLFVLPFFLIYTAAQRKKLKEVSSQRDKYHTQMFSLGKQALEGFREIILFDKINFFKPKFETSVKNFSKAFGKLYLLNAFSPKIIEAIAVLSIFGIFTSGVVLRMDIELLASFLITFALAAYRLIPSINKMIMCYNNTRSSEFVFDHFKKVNIQVTDNALTKQIVKKYSLNI